MELEEIMQESAEVLEKEFYNKKFYFSYSSLNKLIWNPQVFYQQYILGIKEEKLDQHLVQGKVIHALLLEDKKFNDQFIISPANLPTGNLRVVIDRVYNHHKELFRNGDTREKLEEYDGAILDVMRDINYFQALKTDQQRLEKVLTPDALSYWGFLKQKGNKTLVDQETYDFCFNAVEEIKKNKKLCRLIGANLTDFDNKIVINEQPLQLDIKGRIFGLKGIIDNIVVDHDKKEVYINDLKTTSKDLKDFPESIEYYSYWMQAVMYATMVGMLYSDLFNNGYQLKFHFIVIDRNLQSYAFPVSENTLTGWLERFNNTLDQAEWHYKNKSFSLPFAFANEAVIL